MSQQEEMKNLTLLGNKETPYIFEYSPQVLESFDNRHTDNDYFIKFNCPEFTSGCPVIGQSDVNSGQLNLQVSIFLIFQTSSVLSLNL